MTPSCTSATLSPPSAAARGVPLRRAFRIPTPPLVRLVPPPVLVFFSPLFSSRWCCCERKNFAESPPRCPFLFLLCAPFRRRSLDTCLLDPGAPRPASPARVSLRPPLTPPAFRGIDVRLRACRVLAHQICPSSSQPVASLGARLPRSLDLIDPRRCCDLRPRFRRWRVAAPRSCQRCLELPIT